MTQALVDTGREVMLFQRENPQAGFGPQAARMLELWAHGMRDIDEAAAGMLFDASQSI
jgi:hypothetical protein